MLHPPACFHFDKHIDIVAPSDEVHLEAANPESVLNDLVALAEEVLEGRDLPLETEEVAGIGPGLGIGL